MADGLYIPTFIANENFQPAIINPRVFFYNGKRNISPDFKILGLEANLVQATVDEHSAFPYFDHYSAADANTGPTSNSESLLFFNEGTAYGSLPSETLYTKYWQTYIELLYNPKTRFIECEANLPFALYVDLKLNDVVLFKGSHYHLRAINNYNLKTGDCNLQLLGPIIKDSLDNQ
jgi:hypothetical protein